MRIKNPIVPGTLQTYTHHPLTEREREALRKIRAQQGRQWRMNLAEMYEGDCWYGTETDVDTLRNLINRIGGIANIKKLPSF